MWGPAANFDAALKTVSVFIDGNGADGVAKPWHEQEALRQSQREKAAERKAERKKVSRERKAEQQQPFMFPHPPNYPPPSHGSDRSPSRTPRRVRGSGGQQQSRSAAKPSDMPDGMKLNSFQKEFLQSLIDIENVLGNLLLQRQQV